MARQSRFVVVALAFGCFALLGLASRGVWADVIVNGSLAFTSQAGGISFTCVGAPTCNGTLNVTTVDAGCSNTFSYGATVTITGLNLLQPGTLGGILSTPTVEHSSVQPNGTCTYSVSAGSFSLPYTGTWNTATGTMTISGTNSMGDSYELTGPLSASGLPTFASPVFPMTVSASVTPTTASANASMQPRPQDVGANESIFVFAHAPSNLVMGASPVKRVESSPPAAAATKSDAIVCVLAQVNSSGQLVAVSASTMQAYLTGVLTSQSQAVQILNNVSTSNVAGATMYVGYGSDATAMFSSGLYQTAISVPGGVQCTASLASAPAPTLPGALTGLWWNANESGWGIHFTQRGTNVFAAWYTYDAAGNPKWYVASNCTMPGTGPTGTCSGALYEVHASAFFGVPFTPITSANVATAGSLQVNFQDANNATMTYTAAGVTRTVPITRQSVAAGSIAAAIDYTDLWYNAKESGWGMAIAQQLGNVFLAWYVYDATGKPVWYVASNCTLSGSSCSGPLYSTKGPAFGPTFPPNQIQVFTAGSVIVSFIDANTAVLSYTVNGVTATKTITRQIF